MSLAPDHAEDGGDQKLVPFDVFRVGQNEVLFTAHLDPYRFGRANSANHKRMAVQWAIQEGVSLAGADLSDVNLSGMRLISIDLRGANLTQSNLKGATLYRCNLDRANLTRAVLNGVDMDGSSFVGAILEEASLANVSGGKACFDHAALDGVSIESCFFKDTSWFGALLCYARINNTDLSYSGLSSADLSNAFLTNSKLSSCDLREARLTSTFFRDVDLSRSTLTDGAALSDVKTDVISMLKERADGSTQANMLLDLIEKRRFPRAQDPKPRQRPAVRIFSALRPGQPADENPIAALLQGWLQEHVNSTATPAKRGETLLNIFDLPLENNAGAPGPEVIRFDAGRLPPAPLRRLSEMDNDLDRSEPGPA